MTTNIVLDGKPLDECETITSLGLIIDNKLQWTTHINEAIRKTNFKLYTIRQITPYCSIEKSNLLISAMCVFLIRYSVLVWGSAKKSDINSVDKCLMRCVRAVFKVSNAC